MHVLTEIDTPYGRLRYRRAGQGGVPLLLLHGWGGSSRNWANTLAELGRDRAVFAPDLPGYGDSAPNEIAEPERLVEVVISFADAIGLERFDLNGHSFSANLAVRIAARYPERVNRLVLTCLSTFRTEFERQIVNQVHHILGLWLALRRPWMRHNRLIMRLISSRFFYHIPNDQELVVSCFHDFLKMDGQTAAISAASAGAKDFRAVLQTVRVPTRLIVARHDQIMPPSGASAVVEQIPHSQMVWIEDCGHLPMLERPAEYHQRVREFLR